MSAATVVLGLLIVVVGTLAAIGVHGSIVATRRMDRRCACGVQSLIGREFCQTSIMRHEVDRCQPIREVL